MILILVSGVSETVDAHPLSYFRCQFTEHIIGFDLKLWTLNWGLLSVSGITRFLWFKRHISRNLR